MTMSVEATNVATPVCDLVDGGQVDRVMIVRDLQRCTTRKGSEYLRLVVGDRTGSLPAVMWEPESAAVEDAPLLRIVGRVSVHPRYGRQVVITELTGSDLDEVEMSSLLPGPSGGTAALEGRLDHILGEVQDRPLRALLKALLGREAELRSHILRATAAKYNHHAYTGGLLEHTLEVADAVDLIATQHDRIDRDLAITGALLHDIGKLDSYEDDLLSQDFTDAGRLEGEIPLGYYRIRHAIEQLACFPAERARELLHIILSHHGRLEHGSPVVPCTREATVVHAMDELSARLGAFDRVENETPTGESWSRHDRALATSAWLPSRKRDDARSDSAGAQPSGAQS